jgi:hypothetical protein
MAEERCQKARSVILRESLRNPEDRFVGVAPDNCDHERPSQLFA